MRHKSMKTLARQDQALAVQLTEQKLHKLAIKNIISYGTYVIENRALPDFRDGLKPVQRRFMWAMNEASPRWSTNDKTRKSANIVGEIMKYHPHGNSYQTLARMAWFNTPLITIQGNFGELNTIPAAERYTECKLSKYSEEIFLNRSYLAVSPMMPNYDGEYQEPIVLPALLPHLLLNGVEGIAVGVIVGIPPFASKGLLQLIKKAMQTAITVKDCSKYLQVKYSGHFDCEVLTPAAELAEFYKTGSGQLLLGVKHHIDAGRMVITKFTPHFRMETAISKLMAIDEVMSAEDHTDKKSGYRLVVTLKPTISMVDRAKVFTECAKRLQERLNLRINIIERLDAEQVKFEYATMPGLINKWCDWRKQLEVQRAKYVAEQHAKHIARLQLAVLACLNLDKIVPIIKANKPDVEARLATTLDISIEEAKIILEMTLRRLTGLSLVKLREEIAHYKKLYKQARYEAKHPAETVVQQLTQLAKLVEV